MMSHLRAVKKLVLKSFLAKEIISAKVYVMRK